MSDSPFSSREPNIQKNTELRIPQRESHEELIKFAASNDGEREVGIVLPVGCGKSGCIAMAPFAFKSLRTLVVAPNVKIANQLYKDFNPTNPETFYIKRNVLVQAPFPEPAEIRGTITNRGDLDDAHVVVTNIDQLQGDRNRWLQSLPDDYFDLILFDEGHHNVAASWETLKKKFKDASIVNYSATPLRADGKLMAGKIIYSYSVCEAIKNGYVKRLKAIVLNPTTLKYVRREGGEEVEVGLEEVRKLGENDASFRRSIVTSSESLITIVDASINELQRIRKETGEKRLKIIASALNYEHCNQIVEAYRTRGLRTDYVHSKESGKANDRVMQKLENHELDVIVQVRKLGEGFDHPHLSVAAVFSIFSNLSPFVQFVGRVMRALSNDPKDLLNQGSVVFHAGANVAKRWGDFQEYSGADQAYFDELLPLEGLDFSSGDEITIEPMKESNLELDGVEVQAQDQVLLEEIPLIENDIEVQQALDLLKEKGVTPEQYEQALKPVFTTKVQERQAKRASLDVRVKTAITFTLRKKGENPEAKNLDKKFIGDTNFVVLKKALDRCISESIGQRTGKRSEYTSGDLEKINASFQDLLNKAINQTFDA